jgi:uncharacterized membrane protein YgcG
MEQTCAADSRQVRLLYFWLGLLLGFALWLTPASALAQAGEYERILSFDSDIQIKPDGEIEVSERIRVLVLGQDIQRGIMREIPTIYGKRRKVVIPMQFIEVQRNGEAEPYMEYPLDNGVGLRIGSADHLLEHGVHEYLIRYSMNRQIGYMTDWDELYWNVNGNAWEFTIDSISCTVHVPGSVDPDVLRTTAYTGHFGSRGKDFTVEQPGPGNVRFTTTRPMLNYEGLTVVVGFPKGLVAAPPASEQLAWKIQTNGSWMAALLLFSLLFLYYLISWFMVGRDPRLGLVLREERPLNGLTPARLRFIWKREVDQVSMAALMLQLAESGHLKIHSKSKTRWILNKTDLDQSALEPEEQEFLNTIFSGSIRSMELDSDYAATVRRAMDRVRASLVQEMHHVYYEMNARQRQTGILLSISAVVIYIVTYGKGYFLFSAADFMLFLVALLILNIVFYTLLPAYSELGRAVLDRIEGFRLAMRGGEDTLGEYVHADAVLAQQYLPYAVALEVETYWSWHFGNLLRRRNAAAGPPAWYSGKTTGYNSRDGNFSYADFAGHMPRTLARSYRKASVPPPPPPSSSSGGGSSGGWGGGSTSSGSWGSSSGSGFSSSSGSSGGGGGGGGGKGW